MVLWLLDRLMSGCLILNNTIEADIPTTSMGHQFLEVVMSLVAPQHLTLFDSPALLLAGMGRSVKLALNRAAASSKLSREEIVCRASQLAMNAGINLCPGGRLSLDTLNKWLDVNALGNMPSLYGLDVLCRVLENYDALAQYVAGHGLKIIGPEDQKYCELGRAYMEEKRLRQRRRKAEAEL